MTTPPSGQISLGDLKSELSLVNGPSFDISLNDCNYDIMANGFYDTYGYNRIISNDVPLSNFYDLQTDCAYEFRVESSVTDYDQFDSVFENASAAGGVSGAQAQPTQFTNPGVPTNPAFINAIDVTHCDEVIITLTAQNSAGPPFTQDLIIEYSLDSGGSYTAYAGSPFDGPTISLNFGVQNNAPNSASSTPRFTVRCTQ
jgi:hypothetical protein